MHVRRVAIHPAPGAALCDETELNTRAAPARGAPRWLSPWRVVAASTLPSAVPGVGVLVAAAS